MLSAIKIPGFASGGIVVGEKGPELITPMRDASFMATSITKGVVETVKDEMRKSGTMGGGPSHMSVGFDGRLVNKGSDLTYALTSSAIKRSTETLIEDHTITFTNSTGLH